MGTRRLLATPRRNAARRRLAARPGRRAGLLALATALLVACVQDDGSRFNPLRAVIPTWDADEQREAGMAYDRELQKHVHVIHDPVVTEFVNELGQSIVAKVGDQPFIYRFRVIEDPSLNAFALPGGYIYIHSGTLLAAGSVDELAGVMGHEIAHVKARHHFRMAQRTELPNIMAGLVGMALGAATGEGGALVATQAVNVAVQLKFSREFETEADQLGGIFTTRAGFAPEGIANFFERLLEEQRRHPHDVPPYLFSHPAVEERIETVKAAAADLHPSERRDRSLSESMLHAQARLAALIESGRDSYTARSGRPPDLARTTPMLARARALEDAGDRDEALLVLSRAEAAEPADPRVPFAIGDLLFEQRRWEPAVRAYRRTLRLDPSRAMVFYKLGLAYKHLDDAPRAVYAFEQAMLRAGDASLVGRKAAWEVEKLTFTLVAEAGFADGSHHDQADTPAGFTVPRYGPEHTRMFWWARLGPHFASYADQVVVRWRAPSGHVVQDEDADRLRKPYIGSTLDLDDLSEAVEGTWTVEAHIDDEVIETSRVEFGG